MANEITAVAIDKDKHSQAAVKWTVDNLLSDTPHLMLIHVRIRNHSPNSNLSSETNREAFESEIKQLFLPYRGFCARKGVRTKEVILDDGDIPEAIIAYINQYCINNIVVGASTRGFLARKLKNADVPSSLVKSAPDFCSVYVIAKGRAVTIKSASRTPPVTATPPRQSSPVARSRTPSSPGARSRPPSPLGQPSHAPSPSDSEDATKQNWRNEGSDRRSWDRNMRPPWDKSTNKTPNSTFPTDTLSPRTKYSRDTAADANLFLGSSGFRSFDYATNEFPNSSSSVNSTAAIEAEMRRLKMELKQTMDMYSTACKEAVSARHKAVEFHQWKINEARKFEDAKLAEEAALAIAKMQKARTQAANEAAAASKRIAELETKRRKDVEIKALTEAEAKTKVLTALANSNIRYRKYDIEEIEIATDNFSDSLKIGEGGYGPVYRAELDHTPVAIKVLRSDAAQGMKQFQQEVEVLSCIRHPNMVLLLGACPESGCLVYEYMDNGSLEERLFRRGGTPTIPWWTRFKIAAEIATGLLFLHQTKPEPLVHRDLKPGNILLDHNYVTKISDVGLARLVPPSVANTVTQYHMTSAAGTFCYIDPEYQQTGMLGTKSDIYSLGIMLLQLITAKPAMGLTHNVERSIERGTFRGLLDPAVPDWPMEETLAFAKLALQCAELRKKDRPDLGSKILPELLQLRALGESSTIREFRSPANSLPWSPRATQERSSPRLRNSPKSGIRMRSYFEERSTRTLNGEGGAPRLKETPSNATANPSSGEGNSVLSDVLPLHEDKDDE
ncbi:hypothetical protein IFM89_033052 [Coptis chinensis]|uniref:RING-type E3 ubiquitin transferase n=1 Tax=Coptis chinensis TaxID=261450 RepID=A0A835IID6_9MAGN|nr:hypothetical protein IFM89_033052 [Coptis chinensis]